VGKSSTKNRRKPMKLHRFLITAEVITNLSITSQDVIDALHKMVYAHAEYDRDETVAAIPTVYLRVFETKYPRYPHADEVEEAEGL
jgi:hypothetical protein